MEYMALQHRQNIIVAQSGEVPAANKGYIKQENDILNFAG